MQNETYWVLLENGSHCKIRATDVVEAREKVIQYLRGKGIVKRVTGVLRCPEAGIRVRSVA